MLGCSQIKLVEDSSQIILDLQQCIKIAGSEPEFPRILLSLEMSGVAATVERVSELDFLSSPVLLQQAAATQPRIGEEEVVASPS
jgi:hypothetical protein